MSTPTNVRNAVKAGVKGGQLMAPQEPDKLKTVATLIKSYQGSIAKALPKHFTPDRFLQVIYSAIRQNPKLAECDQTSLVAAVMQSAQLGLQPGVLQHCYFIPFYNSKKGVSEVQFQIGYKGLIDLARRTGDVEKIDPYIIHENDVFEVEYGLDEKFKYIPCLDGDPGPVKAYAVMVKFKDGGKQFLVMSKAKVMAHAQKFSKTFSMGPWKEDFDAMAIKTVIKQLIKYLPMSIDLQEKLAADESVKTEISEDMVSVPNTMEFTYDEETGTAAPFQENPVVEAEFTDIPEPTTF